MKSSIKFFVVIMLLLLSVAGAYAAVPSVTMLSTKTCPACVQMQKVLTYLDGQYSGRLETHHIYLEDNPDIARQFNVRYVPTLVFMDGDEKIVAVEVGYKTADSVLATFQKAGVKY